MNSKQRRKFRRKWKYCVDAHSLSVTGCTDPLGVLSYMFDMEVWCSKHIGKKSFLVTYKKGVIFMFDDSQKYMKFMLTWS